MINLAIYPPRIRGGFWPKFFISSRNFFFYVFLNVSLALLLNFIKTFFVTFAMYSIPTNFSENCKFKLTFWCSGLGVSTTIFRLKFLIKVCSIALTCLWMQRHFLLFVTSRSVLTMAILYCSMNLHVITSTKSQKYLKMY